ncbi:MAG: AAA family ATPase, partial [Actinomycetaceae bacterium]|nr:AAA family ATPase [Actinomycetaceae bacterium]
MIENLRIENLGVIAQAELNLPNNLIALTGETGAGKTMAVTSLQLLLGAKADPSKVRHGADAARVEGTFVVRSDSPVLAQIDEVGGVYDEEGDQAIILIARQIPANGRSRAFIGGKAVPISTLNEIAGQLVTVHGQMDQIRLISSAQQRGALDRFAGDKCAKQREHYAQAYHRYHEAQAALDDFLARSKEGARERLALEAFLGKMDEVAPQVGEEKALKEETQRLEGAQERYLVYDNASAFLLGSDERAENALAAIAASVRQLDTIDNADDTDTELRERLDAAEKEIADIAQTLSQRSRESYLDPERLSELYERRQTLQALRKELGMGLDEAIVEAEEARVRLEDLID